MAISAKEKGLDLLCITEHAPRLPGTCHIIYFTNLKVIDRRKYGIDLLLGIEANIMDYNGEIDVKPDVLSEMDICIASLHPPCISPGTLEENTNACIETMKNPYVHILGHLDDRRYPIDHEKIVKAAKEHHVAIEINNNSLSPMSFRHNTEINVIRLVKLCKQWDVPITVASDAHVDDDVGNFSYALPILEKLEFPEALVLNTSVQRFKEFLNKKIIKYNC
jgi:putative hydrolase